MRKTTDVRIGRHKLTLSNLDKVLYPAAGFTKGQMIDYYARVADTLLVHARERPLTLKRYPEGVDRPFFYEKACPPYRPEWMRTVDVKRTWNPKEHVRYCVLTDPASLVWVANLASIEIHVLLSKAAAVQRPTAMVFDLDPGRGCTFVDAAWAALELKSLFDSLKLESFPKSSGKKGIHVYVPLNGKVTYEDTKPFSHAVALFLEGRHPDRIVSNMSKSLRDRKVFVDWSQNDDHKTTVAAYSLRAAERPTVSVPMEWDEVKRAYRRNDPSAFLLEASAAVRRLKSRGDLFADVETLRQRLPEVGALSARPAAAKSAPRRRKPSKRALAEYNAKRDFKITPEPAPAGGQPAEGGAPRFVIQKHAASHLHYDFRLESDGVLKSWAVPKGPSTHPTVRRLAMQTEDHPLSYAGFEGVIPEGEYGGGAVMVWDTGTFVNLTEKKGRLVPFEQGLAKGHIDFWLKGKKLNGAWSLIRLGDPRKWLLKKRAPAADADYEPVETEPDSAITGRSIDRILADRRSRVWHSNR